MLTEPRCGVPDIGWRSTRIADNRGNGQHLDAGGEEGKHTEGSSPCVAARVIALPHADPRCRGGMYTAALLAPATFDSTPL